MLKKREIRMRCTKTKTYFYYLGVQLRVRKFVGIINYL